MAPSSRTPWVRTCDKTRESPSLTRAGFDSRHHLPVTLTEDEKTALRRERDVTFSERGMWTVIATVSLAALLQGKSSLRWGMLRGHAPILTGRFNSRFRPILLERRRVI